jgi:diacylglycerol kinase
MNHFLRTRVKAIGYAVQGWYHVIRTQKNALIHAFFSVGVILVGIWLRLPRRDWAIIFLTIAMVWMAEFINTALEVLTDLVSPDHNHLAKISKDVGATAVLIAAGASVIIGLLILGPPLWQKIQSLTPLF